MTAGETQQAAIDRGQHENWTALTPKVRFERPAMLAELVVNISRGLEVAIGLIHQDELRRQNGEVPVFGLNDTDRMMRFMLATAGLLAEQAEDEIDFLNKRANKEGR